MAPVYCTSADVFSFLQLASNAGFDGRTDFSELTTPKKADVEAWIEENEDHIDEQTMHAWRVKIVTEETHTLEFPSGYWADGTDVKLHHRAIRDLSTGDGDKIEIWNGSTWEDYLTNRVEGRNKDWWIDKTIGMLFIRRYPVRSRQLSLRITYRYGDETVLKDLKKSCVLLTAATLVQNEDRSVLFPEGSDNIDYNTKVENWASKAQEIMNSNREIVIIT